jgi:hypothetical protein
VTSPSASEWTLFTSPIASERVRPNPAKNYDKFVYYHHVSLPVLGGLFLRWLATIRVGITIRINPIPPITIGAKSTMPAILSQGICAIHPTADVIRPAIARIDATNTQKFGDLGEREPMLLPSLL